MSADLFAAFGNPVGQNCDGSVVTKGECQSLQQTPKPSPHHFSLGNSSQKRSKNVNAPKDSLFSKVEGRDDVLFDATADDEFGRFENAVAESLQGTTEVLQSSKMLVDFAGSQVSNVSVAKDSAPEDEDEWGEFEATTSFHSHQRVVHNPETSSHTKVMSIEACPTVISGKPLMYGSPVRRQEKISVKSKQDDLWQWTDFDNQESEPIPVLISTAIPQTESRPDNVPPPATLLDLLVKSFAQITSGKESILPSLVHRTAARIISGRSLRWKRDQALSQSMSISRAGRQGGMKLTSIDKTEARREEQEVEEVRSAWLRTANKLNMNAIQLKQAKISTVLASNAVPKTIAGKDVVTAAKPCPICGLKRVERLPGIDDETMDIFGEYWIEHWGHRDCYSFWYTFERLLNQR